MTAQETKTNGLYAKMAAIMGDLETIPKRGTNKKQGYGYATEADIANAVREQLSAHRIAFLPRMVNVTQEVITASSGSTGYHTMIEFEFSLVCGDTGEIFTAKWFGESDDYSDKSISKASTMAQKYFLLRTFLISTGDPADESDSQGEEAQARRPAKAAKKSYDAATDKRPFTVEAADGFIDWIVGAKLAENRGQAIKRLRIVAEVPEDLEFPAAMADIALGGYTYADLVTGIKARIAEKE